MPSGLSMEKSNLIFLFGPGLLWSLPVSLGPIWMLGRMPAYVCVCVCVGVCVCVVGNKLSHDSISPLYCNHLKLGRERHFEWEWGHFEQEGEKNISANPTERHTNWPWPLASIPVAPDTQGVVDVIILRVQHGSCFLSLQGVVSWQKKKNHKESIKQTKWQIYENMKCYHAVIKCYTHAVVQTNVDKYLWVFLTFVLNVGFSHFFLQRWRSKINVGAGWCD